MLKFAGAPYKVPDNVFVHGFITFSGEKMSKSRGTGISPDVYLDLGLDAEWLRYYIAAKLNGRVEDLDFSPDDFIARVNSDLIGKYVNIASRAASFLGKHFKNKLSSARIEGLYEDAETILDRIARAATELAELYEAREFGRATRRIMALADETNEWFDAVRPWELARDDEKLAELHSICSIAINVFRVLTIYLKPILPDLAQRAEHFL